MPKFNFGPVHPCILNLVEIYPHLTLIPLGGGGGAFSAPPVFFFAVHLDRLEFHVQTLWLFSLKSPAYFDI